MKINHIGIVVDDIDLSRTIYTEMGYLCKDDIFIDDIQNNKLLFLKNKQGNEVIELIQPIDEKSTVYSKANLGLHHICYEVNNFEQFCNKFNKLNIGKIFTNKIISPAFNNRYIVFAYLKNGTIVEFLQGDSEIE